MRKLIKNGLFLIDKRKYFLRFYLSRIRLVLCLKIFSFVCSGVKLLLLFHIRIGLNGAFCSKRISIINKQRDPIEEFISKETTKNCKGRPNIELSSFCLKFRVLDTALSCQKPTKYLNHNRYPNAVFF